MQFLRIKYYESTNMLRKYADLANSIFLNTDHPCSEIINVLFLLSTKYLTSTHTTLHPLLS